MIKILALLLCFFLFCYLQIDNVVLKMHITELRKLIEDLRDGIDKQTQKKTKRTQL